LSAITPVAGAHGGISPGTVRQVKTGSVLTLTATPDVGFAVQHWVVDGQIVQRFGSKYTLRATAAQQRVEVTFRQQIRYPAPEHVPVLIAPYAGDKVAAVSYTFDDGTVSQARYAVPALNAAGFTATFFVVPAFLDARPLADPGGWADWWVAAARGHEIGNHSKSHVDLSACADAALATQIGGGADRITAVLGSTPISFACPFNRMTDRVRDAVLQRHVAVREDWVAMDGMTAAQANAVVDAAILGHRWLVPMLHDVEVKPGGGPVLPLATLQAHLQYVKTRADLVWVAPFGTVARYLRASLAASLDVLADNGIAQRFVLTSALAPESDPVPLTVVLLQPSAEYTSVRVYYDGESVLLPVTYTSYGALVDLVPSDDEIMAVWE
jgi:peptidoglycan/xylan/chitin deacetylase (PgdA/CDA1 family)